MAFSREDAISLWMPFSLMALRGCLVRSVECLPIFLRHHEEKVVAVDRRLGFVVVDVVLEDAGWNVHGRQILEVFGSSELESPADLDVVSAQGLLPSDFFPFGPGAKAAKSGLADDRISLTGAGRRRLFLAASRLPPVVGRRRVSLAASRLPSQADARVGRSLVLVTLLLPFGVGSCLLSPRCLRSFNQVSFLPCLSNCASLEVVFEC